MTEMPSEIAVAIQLAIAPAFLLVGIGQFLVLAAGRLARVIDRARELAERIPENPGPEDMPCVEELRQLDWRMTVVNWSVFFGTAAMVGVCLLVASLFVTRFAHVDYGGAIAIAFIVVMALLVIGLILFLYEVRLANRTIRVRTDLVGHGRKK
jgi:MFS family permease